MEAGRARGLCLAHRLNLFATLLCNCSETPCAWWETEQSGRLGQWIKVSLVRASLTRLVVAGEDAVVCLCSGTNCFGSVQPLCPVSEPQRLMCASGMGYEQCVQALRLPSLSQQGTAPTQHLLGAEEEQAL